MCLQTENLSVRNGLHGELKMTFTSVYVLKNFIVNNHLAKNHKISHLFRHLQVGQTECRKRRIWVGRVKLYISALRLEDGELLVVFFCRVQSFLL